MDVFSVAHHNILSNFTHKSTCCWHCVIEGKVEKGRRPPIIPSAVPRCGHHTECRFEPAAAKIGDSARCDPLPGEIKYQIRHRTREALSDAYQLHRRRRKYIYHSTHQHYQHARYRLCPRNRNIPRSNPTPNSVLFIALFILLRLLLLLSLPRRSIPLFLAVTEFISSPTSHIPSSSSCSTTTPRATFPPAPATSHPSPPIPPTNLALFADHPHLHPTSATFTDQTLIWGTLWAIM